MSHKKTTQQQIALGDPKKLGKRKLLEQLDREPKPTVGLPECPEHLSGRARAAWEFWVPELRTMGLDRLPDAMMLEGACVGYAQAVQADMIVADEGPVCLHITADPQTGKEMRKLRAHPAVAISRSAWTQVRAFCCEFGLSPVSRSRLTIENKGDDAAEMQALLSEPRAPRQQVQ